MTREWWAQASPRERDAAIAEKVMEWKRQTINIIGQSKEVLLGQLGIDYYNQYPEYSSDISAAFSVVEEMEKYDCDFILERTGKQWHANVLGVTASAPTAPEAICLAALLAKEGNS